MSSHKALDLAIIGGGLAGLIHLHYARRAGLDAMVLESRGGVGGLWRELPAWQDIQVCLADWTAGDIPVAGPAQPQILANIESWVDRFALADGIRLNSPVRQARHNGACWELGTPGGTVRARHLVAAIGGHSQPVIPEVERHNSRVRELHSSALHDLTELDGRDVLVVGGGASAFDLLEQSLLHRARSVRWVYRHVRWFTPTNKPKVVAGSFRPYGKMQASDMSVEKQNALIDADLRARYERFGIQAILPERPIDMRYDQLIPGRARMLQRFAEIDRHRGTVQAIDGVEVTLSDGARLTPDLVLWGTGYGTDLRFFEEPRLAAIQTLHELAARCGCIFRSLDAPDLYFPGVGLDGVGATSWFYAIGARTIMSHIRGTAKLDMDPVHRKLNHLDMIRHLVPRDPGSFTPDRGWEFYRDLTLETADDRAYPLP
ncbi:MAG: NAD(P)-binding domain-containing protein [Rhodoferax sp.]|nr:NAD(P)-binding domain-containing protein [Rhodoferax sp.]